MANKIKQSFQLFDGAMGTMLQNQGLEIGEIADEYNLTYPEVVLGIHKEYLEAGAEILTTNTFGANRLRLKDSIYSVREVITAGVKLAQEACDQFIVAGQPVPKKQVALDIGPIGLPLSFEESYEIFKEQIIAGVTAGADLILLETMLDLNEVKAAVVAAKENSNLPVYCTMTFQEDGQTFDGTDIATFVSIVEELRVDALGANCSYGPEQLQAVANGLLKHTSIPVMIQANAGLPKQKDGNLYYDMNPKEYTKEMIKMSEKGVTIFGGCCGTTPEYIIALKESLTKIGDKSFH